jgi:hypothetical protein
MGTGLYRGSIQTFRNRLETMNVMGYKLSDMIHTESGGVREAQPLRNGRLESIDMSG